MGEQLGEAILYLRTDDSALVGGVAKAKGAAQGLASDFGAAGASIAATTKTAGTSATAMAAAAQASARAAVGQAAGFEAVAAKAQLSTLAMRETLVVTRELARGNFTRIPGSLTLLAQGVGSTGGFKAYASQLLSTIGILKTYQNAELAAEAAMAASSAAAVRLAAQRAGASILAADAQVALAEAAVKTAATDEAAAAAQARLAAAHQAVAAAAAEAEIAETALAKAEERSMVAAEASAAATTTSLGLTGAALVGAGVAAAGLILGFEALKTEVADSGVLEDYARSLGLTAEKFDELKQKTDDFALTWGDVWGGIKKATADAFEQSSAWSAFKSGNEDAFKSALSSAVNFASMCDGYVIGAYRTIVDTWNEFPSVIGSAFVSAVNAAITEINKLLKASVDGINGLIDQANRLPLVNLSHLGAPSIALLQNSYAKAGKDAGKSFAQNVAQATAESKAQIERNLSALWGDIIGAAEDRIKKEGGKPPKPPKAKKPNDHGLGEALDMLDAEIEGQYRLAAAYQISDAAAIKAEALQKAEQDAIKHKSETGVFYEKELAKAVATTAAEGAKQIAQLRDEADARGRVNSMVAAGVIPASQMQQQLQLEAKIRPLLVAYDLADIKHKPQIAAEIANLNNEYAKYLTQLGESAALQQIAHNDDELGRLRLEASLIGASNRERAVALAQLQAIQFIRDHGVQDTAEDPTIVERTIKSFVDVANASVLSPFQQWAQGIPQDADAINAALQGIEVKGIDGLSSAIAGVITGTESLKQAFRQLAQSIIGDILQMIVKMLIFRALSSAFGGLFGGGIPKPDLNTPWSVNLDTQPLAHLAGGGLLSVGGNGGVDRNLLSINGVPRAMVSADETLAVIPSGTSAANSNAPAVIQLIVTGDDLWKVQVGQVANAVVELKTPGIVGKAKKATIGAMTKTRIGG